MCQENLDQKHAVSRWQPSEFVLSSGPAELREAVADIMLMATSDELIINPWSSYGQMAAVRRQLLVARVAPRAQLLLLFPPQAPTLTFAVVCAVFAGFSRCITASPRTGCPISSSPRATTMGRPRKSCASERRRLSLLRIDCMTDLVLCVAARAASN